MKKIKTLIYFGFLLTSLLFLLIGINDIRNEPLNFIYNTTVLIPLSVALIALFKFTTKNKIAYDETYRIFGINISISLILWCIGDIIWTYYTLKGIEYPFPSIADLFYVFFSVVTISGLFSLHRAIAEDQLADLHKISAYVVLITINSFVLLFKFIPLEDANRSELFIPFILNLLYTSFDCIALAIIFCLLLGKQNGLDVNVRKSIKYLSWATILYFVGDIFFGISISFDSNEANSYYSGSWIDLIFTVSMLLISLSIHKLLIPNRKTT